MSAVNVRSVLTESESLLRAVDSTEGSYLDAKADQLATANLAVVELMEALSKYKAEYENPSPDYSLRFAYRAQVFEAAARCQGESA